jgi:pyrroloquinoline quinone biosynthesis protein B
MRIRILGSAAGGGLPQWNCRCCNCEAVRAGIGDVRPRTQSSVAISADERTWFLLNVSPDIRQQILGCPALGPPAGQGRGQSIAGCVLTDAEIDHCAGLLFLREGRSFNVISTPTVRRWLTHYLSISSVLAPFANPSWLDMPTDLPLEISSPDGTPTGLHLRAFEVDRHVPRFVPEEGTDAVGAVVGLEIADARTEGKLVYVPCLGGLSERLAEAVRHADCLLLDGTFWSDEEPVRAGIGARTALEMSHMPVSGPNGSLNWLAGLPVRHRVYIHINNTNPMLNEAGAEHRLVLSNGVRVGMDGDTFDV